MTLCCSVLFLTYRDGVVAPAVWFTGLSVDAVVVSRAVGRKWLCTAVVVVAVVVYIDSLTHASPLFFVASGAMRSRLDIASAGSSP